MMPDDFQSSLAADLQYAGTVADQASRVTSMLPRRYPNVQAAEVLALSAANTALLPLLAGDGQSGHG